MKMLIELPLYMYDEQRMKIIQSAVILKKLYNSENYLSKHNTLFQSHLGKSNLLWSNLFVEESED